MKEKKPRKLFARHIVRKLFLEDWAMKLTALVITFALWFGVTGLSTPITKRFSVPLNLSVSNNSEITTAQQELEIVVSGDKRKIDQINKADLTATIDLADASPGDLVVSVMPENVAVPLPQGVKLIEVLPIRFLVKLEAVVEKDIEVRAQTEGNLAAGLEIYTTTVTPSKIRVRGPASFINTLEFVETGKLDISGKRESFTARQIPVSVANPQAAVLNTVVDVYFRIGEKRIERAFSIPIDGSPAGIASFTIYGPRTLLAKTKADAFKIEMSEDGEPQVILPAELQDVVEIRKLAVK